MQGKLLLIDLGGVVLDNHKARAADFALAWGNLLADDSLDKSFKGQLAAATEEDLSLAIWGTTPAKAGAAILTKLDLTPPQQINFADLIRNHYRQIRTNKNSVPEEPPFNGIEAALRALKAKGCDMIAISRKKEPESRRFLAHYNMSDIFSSVISSEHEEKTSEGLLAGLKEKDVSLKSSSVLLIGDTIIDMQAAKGAGMRALMASWGHPKDLAIDYSGRMVSGIPQLPEAAERALSAISLDVLDFRTSPLR